MPKIVYWWALTGPTRAALPIAGFGGCGAPRGVKNERKRDERGRKGGKGWGNGLCNSSFLRKYPVIYCNAIALKWSFAAAFICFIRI